MYIDMFNGWYFFWLLLSAGAIVGLYFALRHKSVGTPGPQEGLGVPSPAVPAPQISHASPSVVPVSQVRTLRARDETIPSEWHMSKGWGQDVHTT